MPSSGKTTLKTRTPLFFEGPCFFAEGLVFRPSEKTTLKKQPPKTSVITALSYLVSPSREEKEEGLGGVESTDIKDIKDIKRYKKI